MNPPTTNTLTDLELPLPGRVAGKVRVSYTLPDDRRLFITTDRLSAFDRHITDIPGKGQVLNELSAWWFDQTRDLVPNHLLSVPDPNVLIARAAQPLPVEVIVRGRITGVTPTSLWMRYAQGERLLDGHRLPEGLQKNDALPVPLITPTTKAGPGGHDEPLACAEVAARGLVAPGLWERVQTIALRLFARGVETAERVGLLLADTKYEFGLDRDGQLLLIDEVHTPDSSRFWIAATADERLRAGEEPESADKEIVRRTLAAAGWRGEGPPPALPEEVRMETARRYVQTYEMLTGRRFFPAALPAAPRILANLRSAGIL
ncbi:MAG: phosphoribosylaminoimidazolesuccinocarboxamide synthase [Chthoniobacterales bacterium]